MVVDKKYLLAIVLSWPFFIEVTRRFVLASDWVIVGGEVFICPLFIWSVAKGGVIRRKSLPIFVAGWSFFLIATASTLYATGPKLGPYLVGVHSLLVPVLYYTTVSRLSEGVSRPATIAGCTMTFWTGLAVVIAVVQLLGGAPDSLNQLPNHMGAATGVFSGTQSELLAFRPSSYFLSPGKFGKVIFTVVVFKLTLLGVRSENELSGWLFISLLIDCTALALTGQRIAWILAVIALVLVTVPRREGGRGRVLAGLLMMVGVVYMGSRVFGGVEDVILDLKESFVSGIASGPERFSSQVIWPASRLFDEAGLLGNGFGMYIPGSQQFGGVAVRSEVNVGNPEGSWYRILVETGVIGLTTFIILIAALANRLIAEFRSQVGERKTGALFLLLWVGLAAGWGLFHNFFSASMATAIAFGLGATSSPRWR